MRNVTVHFEATALHLLLITVVIALRTKIQTGLFVCQAISQALSNLIFPITNAKGGTVTYCYFYFKHSGTEI